MSDTAQNPGALSADWARELAGSFSEDRANRVARNAVTSDGIMAAARDLAKMRTYHDTYGISRAKTGDITNQRQSGRCWMFATFNVVRAQTMELLDVDTFEFSQSFGMFYDKLEKTNAFFENVIATADRPVEDRDVAMILDDGIEDGGYVVFALNLIQKYGLVPKDAMPETACSKNSSEMNQQLDRLARKGALEIRKAHAAGASLEDLRAIKQRYMAHVHRLLSVCLGEPPTTFNFEYKVGKNAKVDAAKISCVEPEPKADATGEKTDVADHDDKDGASSDKSSDKVFILRDKNITPLQFVERYVKVDPTDWVDLISNPMDEYPYGHAYHMRIFDSVVGAQPLHSLNCKMEVLEDAAIRSLKAGVPVAMACDVLQEFPRHIEDYKYVLALDTMDFASLFGTDLSMDRKDLLSIRETYLSHEMTFQGVELDENGRPVAWRIENSWGKDAGKDGYLIMSADWFRTYGGNVTVRREFVDEETLNLWDNAPVEEVDPWSNLSRSMAPKH
ncbi:MAG: aminopeptidase C [Atopobiaceae bacterium]|jgi:bleomycin hydrolase